MVLISYMFMKVFVKWLFRKVWFLRFFLDCFIIKDWRSFRSGLFVLVGSDFSFCREMFGLKSDRLLLDALDRLGGLGRLKLKVVVFGFNLFGLFSLFSVFNNNLFDFSLDIFLQELELLFIKIDGFDLEFFQFFMIEQFKKSFKNQVFLDNYLTEVFMSMYDVKIMFVFFFQIKNLFY